MSLPEWTSGVLADKQGSNHKLCDALGNWELATMGREASVSEKCLSFTHCPFKFFPLCEVTAETRPFSNVQERRAGNVECSGLKTVSVNRDMASVALCYKSLIKAGLKTPSFLTQFRGTISH